MFLNIWVTIRTVRKIWKRVLLGGIGISIGFMLIFSTTILTDSIYRSILEDNLQTLQETDILLFSTDISIGSTFNDSIIREIESNNELYSLTDAISGQLIYGVTLICSETNSSVWGVLHGINVTRDRQFGPLTIDGEPLDEVQLGSENGSINTVITQNIKEGLNISKGDTFKIPFTVNQGDGMILVDFAVVGILDDEGRAKSNNKDNIYVDLLSLQNTLNLTNRINEVLISLNGDVIDGLKHEDHFLDALNNNMLSNEAWSNLGIFRIKRSAYNEARGGARSFSGFFSALGLIGIASAVFLIGTIYYILLEERRGDIAILRSLGLVKFDIFKQFLLESLITGFIAGVIGVFGTIIITNLFLEALSSIYQPGFYFVGQVEFSRPYTLFIKLESLIESFLLGLTFVMAIATFASWRISSMNIIATFQESEINMIQYPNKRKYIFFLFVSIVFISLGISVLQLSLILFAVLVSIGTLFGFLFLYSWQKERFQILGTIYSILILIPIIALVLFLVNNSTFNFESFLFTIYSWIYILILIAVLVILQLNSIMKLILKLSMMKSSHILLYCQGNVSKSKIKIFFSVIIFSLMISVMQGVVLMADASYHANEATMDQTWMYGADFRASTVLPVNISEWYQKLDLTLKENINNIAGWSRTTTSIAREVGEEMEWWYNNTKDQSPIIGIDSDTKDLFNVRIKGKSIFESEESVWTEVLSGKGVLVPSWFEYNDFQLQDIVISTDIGNVSIPAIGYIYSSSGSIFMSKTLMKSFFADVIGDNTLFIKLKSSAHIGEADEKLRNSLSEWGLSLTNREEFIGDLTQVILLGTLMFEGYFSIGVFLAFIGLSLILYRNIQLRWHEFGILTAMGMSRTETATAIILESFIISILAFVIGTSTSFIVLKPALGALQGVSSYSVDIVAVIFWTVLVILSSLIATFIPILFFKNKGELDLIREIAL
jgi:ABC-type antimicrobial peptide transport system permease subunit